MRVLIACEFSGVVRRAFRAIGHDAWSCDLLPADDGTDRFPAYTSGTGHLQTNALTILGGLHKYFTCCPNAPWDLIIAHPPCTYLCNSGVRWLAPGGCLDPKRHKLMMEACDFFAALYWADVPRVAVENPVMHKYARDYLKSAWKIPTHTQTIQPWQFGHGEVKRTCFWLRGLAPLKPDNIVPGRVARVHRASPAPDRWKERSRTLPGIARAMAQQWSA